MKSGTFSFIEQILREYPDSELYIQKRYEELKYPTTIYEDENMGGGRSSGTSNPTERMAITIVEDKRLQNLEKTRKAIETVLSECNDSVKEIIEEFYFKKPRLKTWEGIAQDLHISERHCRRLRGMFFDRLADELGLPK